MSIQTREDKIKAEDERINNLMKGKVSEAKPQEQENTAPAALETQAVANREPEKPVEQKVQQPNTGDDPNSDTWKHKFSVLDGKYRNEVPRLQTRITELEGKNGNLKEQILRLEGKVDALSSGKPADKATEAAATDDDGDLLDKEYGKELGNGVDQRIEKRMKETLARLDKVEQNTAKTVTGNFYKDLDGLAVGWEQKNTDPAFIKFINANGPAGTDDTYATLLTRAFEQQNSLRVSEIFNLYGGTKQAATQTPTNSLDDQIVPGRGQGGESRTGEKANEMSRADIKEFYRKVQAAPHRYSEEEIAKFERKVERAVKGGNVS